MVSIQNINNIIDITDNELIKCYENENEHAIRIIDEYIIDEELNYRFIITSYGNFYYIYEDMTDNEIQIIKLNISINKPLSSFQISNIQKINFEFKYTQSYDPLFGYTKYVNIIKSLQLFIDIINKY